jgi:8-oxo-dGTP pyrophosphatase MutT (NUDIX family)
MKDYIKYLRSKIGHDPALSVGLTAIIENEKGELLLEKRSDNGRYCFPGGGIDYEEKVLAGVSREVEEETGLKIKDWSLFMITSGPENTLTYPNTDVTNYVNLTFYAKIDSSTQKIAPEDHESTAVFFCSKDHLPPLKEWLPGSAKMVQKYLRGDFNVTID